MPVPYRQTLDAALALAPQLQPMVADVAALIQEARRRGDSLLFEGAQGALLDIDHGTYPYVTSSNCLAGAAAPGCGIGPQLLDYVLGIVKAYTTRVGTGPFPTELSDDIGATLAKRGNEFGSVTGRPRRCGWLDSAGAQALAAVEWRRRLVHHQARRARRHRPDQDLHRVHRSPERGSICFRPAPRPSPNASPFTRRCRAGTEHASASNASTICRRMPAPICAASSSSPECPSPWCRPDPSATRRF